MHIRLKIVLLLSALAVSGFSFAAPAYSEEAAAVPAETVKILLSAEKTSYSIGEPMELTVALTNMTGLDNKLNVRVCQRLDIEAYIYIVAKDETGKSYKGFLGAGEDITTFHLHTLYTLKPREEKRFKFSVANLFTTRNTAGELPITDIAAAPGTYSVSAGISEISLESAPIKITIIEPPKTAPAEPVQELAPIAP